MIKQTDFLTAFSVIDNSNNEWLPVEYIRKTSQLIFLGNTIYPKEVRVICTDIFGRVSTQILTISR
jgi:hypothetical protein